MVVAEADALDVRVRSPRRQQRAPVVTNSPTRKEQGLLPRVADPAVLARIARLLKAGRNG